MDETEEQMPGKPGTPSTPVSSLTGFGLDNASQSADRDASSGAATAGYRDIADIYRQRWRWDRVVKGTHILNCWYQRNCSFHLRPASAILQPGQSDRDTRVEVVKA
jgi:hypothetical protein